MANSRACRARTARTQSYRLTQSRAGSLYRCGGASHRVCVAVGLPMAAESLMRVHVKTVQGDTLQMEVQPTTTVLDTITRATVQIGVEPGASSLVFRGRVLEESDAIGDAGIVDGSCVILARRRPRAVAAPTAAKPEAEHASSQQITLVCRRVGSEASTRVSVETSGTLVSIIRQLKWQWDASSVRLVHGGRVLHPDQRVSDAGLGDGMTLFGMVSQATVAPGATVHQRCCTSGVASAAAEAAAAALNGDAGSDDDDHGHPVVTREESETRATSSGDGADSCRICHGGREFESELGPLFSPCRCRGTVASVHVECLNRWRRMSANPSSYFACDQCGYRYQMDRTRWARWVETGAAAEIATVMACAFMVCAAAVPCYYLSLHSHFYLLCSLLPYWQSSDWATTLDFLAAGLIGTSAVFYSLWVYSLYYSGNFTHMFHLGLTVAANGTRIFRLLALSGSLMAWRAIHAQVRVSARMVMQRFGERLREAPPLEPAGPAPA